MPAAAARRRWPRVAALVLAVLAVGLLAGSFAATNRHQTIRLDLGPWTWSGDAVHALFIAGFLGLWIMFLLGLPADLAARDERRRLGGRVRTLERELESERALRRAASAPSDGGGAAGETAPDREEPPRRTSAAEA